MGEFLSTPIRDKISEEGENEYVNYTNLDKIWSFWNAWMEKENGRLSHI
jgi:hypothetical protein